MPCKEVRFSSDLQTYYNGLGTNAAIRKWLDDMKAMLLENMFRGDRIPKDRIPPFYLVEYGVHNLYHYPHPEDHRSMYTIKNEGNGPYPLVVDFLNHDEYNKRFGYYKKKSG